MSTRDFRAGFAAAAQLCRALPAVATARHAAAVLAGCLRHRRPACVAPDPRIQHVLHAVDPVPHFSDPYGGYVS